jgi:uncharacterized membrane protein YfhO
MSLVLYLLTALALLWIVRRWVMPVSRTAALALLLFPFCFMGKALLTGGAYGPFDMPYETEPLHSIRSLYGVTPAHNAMLNDIYTQMIPYRQTLHEKLLHFEWPLWNPHTLCGELLAASAQPGAFNPFTLLAALLPTSISFAYSASMTFFLAGLSLFLLARDLGCRESAAALGAAGWMYASAISFFALWPHSGAWAVLPLVLFGTRRVVREPGARSTAVLTAALSLCIMAGHPESVLHVVSLGIPYGIYELIRAPREQRLRAVAFACASGVLTLLLTAIYLLPFADATLQTHEYAFRKSASVGSPHGVEMPEVWMRMATAFFATAENRMWKVDDPQSLPPDAAGAGSIVLAAAVYALWRSRHRDKWFFGALLLFTLVAHSEWRPFAAALQKLPLFDIAINGRYSFGAACLIAILGAIGVEELLARKDWTAFAATAVIVLLFITVGSYVLESRYLRFNENYWGDFRLFADVALLGIVALIVVLRTPMRFTAPALVALVLLQRTVQESAIVPTFRPSSAYPPVPLLEPLKKANGLYRIAGEGVNFVPGASAMYGLEDVRGYSAMILREIWDSYPLWSRDEPVSFNRIEGTEGLSRPFLSFLNLRYAILVIYTQTPKGWHDVTSYRKSRLIEIDNVIERAFVPRRVVIGYDEKQTLDQMKRETDFRDRAWLSAPLSHQERANGPGEVKIEPRKYGYAMDVTMSDDGWVVASEPAWRGWRAYVDGRRIEHQVANIAFIGIHVPKGRHKVKLIYMPRSFVIGRALTLLTIVVLLLLQFIPSAARDQWRRLRTVRDVSRS